MDNGVSVFSNTIGSYGQDDPFNLYETLNAGDTIDFEVLTGSIGCSYCYLSTGSMLRSGRPEPASFTLLEGALVAFGLARRRKRRRAAAALATAKALKDFLANHRPSWA